MSTKIISSDWQAWNDLQPPTPFHFHVTGEVQVPNPGVVAFLYPKVPPGISPDTLLLDLYLFQRPGKWPQHVTLAQATYEKFILKPQYKKVVVSFKKQEVATINVKDIE